MEKTGRHISTEHRQTGYQQGKARIRLFLVHVMFIVYVALIVHVHWRQYVK
jgi:hypothetical protein